MEDTTADTDGGHGTTAEKCKRDWVESIGPKSCAQSHCPKIFTKATADSID